MGGLTVATDAVPAIAGIVTDLLPGPLESSVVQKRHRLVEVNGVNGTCAEMLAVIQRESKLTMRFRMPNYFKISLVKDHDLGVDLGKAHGHNFLWVNEVLEKGVVKKFNDANPDKALMYLDLITDVNGQKGEGKLLMSLIAEAVDLELSLLRY